MKPNRSEDEEYDHPDHGVSYCVPRWNKRARGVCSYLGPVEGNGDQRDPGPAAEELVYSDIIGADPADKCKNAEEGRDEAGEPVPTKGAEEDNEEVSVSGDTPAIALCWVGLGLIVETVEQSGVD